MKLHMESARIFVPDGRAGIEALSRTTHLAIGAHADDIEIMASDGIMKCFQSPSRWFTGVTVTNGSGSPRAGIYEAYSDDQMQTVRAKEQRKAAVVGEYAAQVMLDYPSTVVKDSSKRQVVEDIAQVLRAAKPEVVYTHNLTDKHETHIAVALRVIAAVRSLPERYRPRQLYGSEIWRNLDWMVDDQKVILDCSDHENMQAALLGVFDSQISGGKRYDLAAMGRRRANATFFESHATDTATGIAFAMDLTPVVSSAPDQMPLYIKNAIGRFQKEVVDRINRLQ